MKVTTPYNMTTDIPVLNQDNKPFVDRCFYIGIGHHRNIEKVVYADNLQEALDIVIDWAETQDAPGWFLTNEELDEEQGTLEEYIYGGNHCRYMSFGNEELLVKELTYHDTDISMLCHGVMLSDYYRGTSGITLQVPVDNETTLETMINGIESDFNEFEIYEPEDNHNATIEEIETFFAEWLVEMRDQDLSRLVAGDLDTYDEDDEGCYVFYSIEFN